MNNPMSYIQNGDYLIPNLKLSQQPEKPLGKYGSCLLYTSSPRNGKPRMRSRTSRMLTGAAQKKMTRTALNDPIHRQSL